MNGGVHAKDLVLVQAKEMVSSSKTVRSLAKFKSMTRKRTTMMVDVKTHVKNASWLF